MAAVVAIFYTFGTILFHLSWRGNLSLGRIHVRERESGKLIPLTGGGRSILSTPRNSPWKHLRLEHLGVEPYEMDEAESEREHLVGLVTSSHHPFVEWRKEGKLRSHTFRAGEMVLSPMGQLGSWRSADSHEAMVIALNHQFLVDRALEAGLSSFFEILDKVPFVDDFLAACMARLAEEVKEGFPGQQLLGDSIATNIGIHLLARHASIKLVDESGARLDGTKLRTVIDYMKEHYQEDVSLSQLAEIAHVSPSHFLRMFKAATSFTPHQYLINYRIELGRELLLKGDCSVKQVARSVGFCDSSHFTRYFKRIMNMSPNQFCKSDAKEEETAAASVDQDICD